MNLANMNHVVQNDGPNHFKDIATHRLTMLPAITCSPLATPFGGSCVFDHYYGTPGPCRSCHLLLLRHSHADGRTARKGTALAKRQWNTQGKGTVLAAKAKYKAKAWCITAPEGDAAFPLK